MSKKEKSSLEKLSRFDAPIVEDSMMNPMENAPIVEHLGDECELNEEEEAIRKQLERLIPSGLSRFPKLRSGEPYDFDRWDYDQKGRYCLYYVITGGKTEHRKRIPMHELIKAVSWFNKSGIFKRTDFQRLCPIANGDGPCGYAVTSSILESLSGRKIPRP